MVATEYPSSFALSAADMRPACVVLAAGSVTVWKPSSAAPVDEMCFATNCIVICVVLGVTAEIFCRKPSPPALVRPRLSSRKFVLDSSVSFCLSEADMRPLAELVAVE